MSSDIKRAIEYAVQWARKSYDEEHPIECWTECQCGRMETLGTMLKAAQHAEAIADQLATLAPLTERLAAAEAERDAWKHEHRRMFNACADIYGKSPEDADMACAERIFSVLKKWQDKQPLNGRMMVQVPMDCEPIARIIREHFAVLKNRETATTPGANP